MCTVDMGENSIEISFVLSDFPMKHNLPLTLRPIWERKRDIDRHSHSHSYKQMNRIDFIERNTIYDWLVACMLTWFDVINKRRQKTTTIVNFMFSGCESCNIYINFWIRMPYISNAHSCLIKSQFKSIPCVAVTPIFWLNSKHAPVYTHSIRHTYINELISMPYSNFNIILKWTSM